MGAMNTSMSSRPAWALQSRNYRDDQNGVPQILPQKFRRHNIEQREKISYGNQKYAEAQQHDQDEVEVLIDTNQRPNGPSPWNPIRKFNM